MKSIDRSARRRTRAAVACVAVFIKITMLGPLAVAAAQPAQWSHVEAALSRLPTVTGQNVLDRARSCGIVIHRRTSHLKKTKDVSELWVPVTIPNGPNDHYLPIVISWLLKDGKATPTSAWAQKLQEKPGPLGFDGNMRC